LDQDSRIRQISKSLKLQNMAPKKILYKPLNNSKEKKEEPRDYQLQMLINHTNFIDIEKIIGRV